MMEEGGDLDVNSGSGLPDGNFDNDFLSSSVAKLRPSFPDSVQSAADSL